MAIVMMVFVIGLAIAAYNSKPGGVRIFLLLFCLLNALGAASMIASNDRYAFRLKPNDGAAYDNYRRR